MTRPSLTLPDRFWAVLQEQVPSLVPTIGERLDGYADFGLCLHIFHSLTVFPTPDGPGHDLHVASVYERGILSLRLASDAEGEVFIPMRAVDRVRLVKKEDRLQVEVRHGECISWFEQVSTEISGSGAAEFFRAVTGLLVMC